MSRLSCPRRASPSSVSSLVLLLVLVAIVAACAPQVAPTASTAESGPLASDAAPSGSPGAPTPNATSPASPRSSEAAGGTGSTPDPLASPPPAGDPQDDEACLAIIPRAAVEELLGAVGDIVAIGTDPATNLTCTYTAGDGSLLVTTAASDATTGFQTSLDLATGYGQNPVGIDGIGDQAFYARAADRWPEQVVFVKGPVLVRLINQTSATIGEVPFAALAATAAEAIRAEIPPAP